MAWPASGLLLLALCWLLAPRVAGMGGYDNYYYLLYARDLASGIHEGLQARYLYFPGVYHFWRVVLLISDGSYAACQSAFALAGLANAALVILIARAAGCGKAVAALAGASYLAIGQRLEFEAMTSEPLVTAAALFGLLGWVFAERRGRSGLGLAALGTGLGLALFAKQQGILLAAGLAGTLTGIGRSEHGPAWAARGTAGALGAMLAAFSVAMWLDGGGMAAVRLALEFAQGYEAHGELIENLAPVWRRTPLAALLCFAVLVGCALTFHARWQRRRIDAVLLALLWICAFAAMATLLQFSKRGYAHYGLLTLPFVLLAAAAAVSLLRDRLSPIIKRHAAFSISMSVSLWAVLAVSLLHATTDWARRDPLKPPMHDAYRAVCATVVRGERLLLLPSREDALHWVCGTQAAGIAFGYGWTDWTVEGYIEELRKPELRQVFVFRPAGPRSYEAKVLAGERWQPFYAALRDHGFVRAADFTQGTVYRRP